MKKLKFLKLQRFFYSSLAYLSFVGTLFFTFIFVRLDSRFPGFAHDKIFFIIASFKIVFILLIFTIMLLSLFLKNDTEKQITATISELRAKERAKKKSKKKVKKKVNKKNKDKNKMKNKDHYEGLKVNKINKKTTLKQNKSFTKTKNYDKIKGKKNKKNNSKKGEVRWLQKIMTT